MRRLSRVRGPPTALRFLPGGPDPTICGTGQNPGGSFGEALTFTRATTKYCSLDTHAAILYSQDGAAFNPLFYPGENVIGDVAGTTALVVRDGHGSFVGVRDFLGDWSSVFTVSGEFGGQGANFRPDLTYWEMIYDGSTVTPGEVLTGSQSKATATVQASGAYNLGDNWIDVQDLVGDFVVGETITGNMGASFVCASLTYRYCEIAETFTTPSAGDVVKGKTSGAVGVLRAITGAAPITLMVVQISGSFSSSERWYVPYKIHADITSLVTSPLVQVPNNYILWSQDLSNAAWTKRGTGTVTANAGTAPDGTNTANLLTVNTNGNDVFQVATLPAPNGFPLALSFYLKPSSTSGTITIWNVQGGTFGEWTIDLSLLTPGAWTRVTASHLAVTVVSPFVGKNGAPGPQFLTQSGSPKSFYVWGVQLQPGAAVTPYLARTSTIPSAPAIELGKGLLVEAPHTNLILGSNDLAGTSWSFNTGTGISGTSNAAIAPDGTLTASRIDLAQVATGAYEYQSAGVLSNAPYTLSVWLRAATAMNVYVSLKDVASTYYTKVCAVTTSWQRFVLTATPAAGATYVVIGNNEGTNPTLPIQSYYAWGAQVETGSIAHSLAPTTTAMATCDGDQASFVTPAGLPTVAGVVEVDFTPLWNTLTGPSDAVVFNTGAAGINGITLDISGSTMTAFVGGNVVQASSPQTWTPGQRYRLRLQWAAGTVQMFRDDVLIKSTTGLTISVTHDSTMYIGRQVTTQGFADGSISDLVFRSA